MKKLAVVTPDCFLDTDIEIIRYLANQYDLLWIVTYPSSANNAVMKFSVNAVEAYCHEHKIRYRIFIARNRIRNLHNLGQAYQIILEIKKFDPLLVYFNHFGNIYLPFISTCYLGTVSIVSIHDAKHHTGSGSFFHRLLDRFISGAFQNFQLFSETQAAIFQSRHKTKRVFNIPMAVKNFGIIPENLSGSKKAGKTCFLFFGTIHYYKGLNVLLSAVNILGKKRKDFRIMVCGACNNMTEYREIIEDPGLFEFRTYLIPNDEIPGIFGEADFLVLPYRDVSQSGPLFIAYKYGVPVIASDHPGFRECIREAETGFIFKNEDPQDLAGVMDRCLGISSADRQVIRESIHKLVMEKYSPDIVAGKYFEMFSSLIS